MRGLLVLGLSGSFTWNATVEALAMTGLLDRGLGGSFTWIAKVEALAMTGVLDRGLSGAVSVPRQPGQILPKKKKKNGPGLDFCIQVPNHP